MITSGTLPAWIQKNTEVSTPAWLQQYKQQHWDAFQCAGLPARQNERWKYADLNFLHHKQYTLADKTEATHLEDAIQQHRLQREENILLVMVNGYFIPALSDMNKLPPGVIACTLSEAIQKHPDIIQSNGLHQIDASKYPFGSLNAALFVDGLYLQIPDHCEVIHTIHLLSLMTGEEEKITHPRHMVILGKQSKVTLFDEYFSSPEQMYMVNSVTTVHVSDNAKLNYYKAQQSSAHVVQMTYTLIRQQKNSNVTWMDFNLGGTFARDDIFVDLQEAGADCRTAGFYRIVNGQLDHHIDIQHKAPCSYSEMLYKGIVDRKARAVFNGRLHVAKDAQKITAYQANHHLLISNVAEAYSKPELEIYADDVKCKHGATTGQLDNEALFYLRSRGIPHAEAVNILLQGFSEEIVQRITHPGIQMRIREMLSL
jgi:Fe-S cluster assembly protein SufD